MRVPNFAAFDDIGNLFVTDSGTWGADDGLIFRVTAEGRTDVWTGDVPAFPNGCCLSEDGGELLVLASTPRPQPKSMTGPGGDIHPSASASRSSGDGSDRCHQAHSPES
jgi:sugar lactone lactonase YvrE